MFKLSGTCDDAGDEYFYYSKTTGSISTNTYPYYLFRWKTGSSANALGARVLAVFTGGSPNSQWLLGETEPQFNVTWQVKSGTLLADRTMLGFRLYADDYPDSVASGDFDVYYEFILLHKGIFTLPNVAYGLQFKPPPRYAQIPFPGRIGNVTQNLGGESATVEIGCDLGQGTWKRSGDYVDAQVFYDIAHNSGSEAWQWLDTGQEQFKVVLEQPRISRNISGNKAERRLNLLFREYRLSSASNETDVERFGLNL